MSCPYCSRCPTCGRPYYYGGPNYWYYPWPTTTTMPPINIGGTSTTSVSHVGSSTATLGTALGVCAHGETKS